MKAKRIFAGLSAMTLATAMLTVNAFASEAPDRIEIKPDDSGNPNPNPASTTVTYSVDPSYTVTIPKSVTLSDSKDVTDSVSASDVRLEKGKMIVVSLADTNDFKVKNGDESVTYKVSNTAGELAAGKTVKEFTADDLNPETLTFAKINKADVKYAGDYTGSLTFNIAVESASTPVTAITLNKTETTIVKGSDETLSVTAVTPDNATDKTVTWSSDEESVATVDADGKVTAVAAGTANITATANDGSGVTATCVVTVAPLYYDKAVQVYQYDNPGYRDYVYAGNYKTLSADEGYALAQYFASVNSCSVCVITDWIDSNGKMKYVTNSSSAEQQSTPSFFGRYDRVYLVPKN